MHSFPKANISIPENDLGFKTLLVYIKKVRYSTQARLEAWDVDSDSTIWDEISKKKVFCLFQKSVKNEQKFNKNECGVV